MLPHELGHALAALAVGAPTARVEVGSPRGRINGRIGRLRFDVSPLSSTRWLWFGRAFNDLDSDAVWRRVAITSAGPVTSAVLAVAFAALGSTSKGLLAPTSYCLAASLLIQFLSTALPIRYRRGPYAGSVSDGRRILEQLRRRAEVTATNRQV